MQNVLTSAVPHRSEWRRRRTTEEDADNDRSEGGAAVVQICYIVACYFIMACNRYLNF